MTEESQKMCYQIAGMILVYLQLTASQKGTMIQQSPPEILLAPGQTAQIDCKLSTGDMLVLWYKELQNGNLQRIHWSYAYTPPSDEKYSSKVNTTTNTHTLIIRNVQRKNSGVYYCGLYAANINPDFGTGTRLIVTDNSELTLSILVLSIPEDAELPFDIPLLCLLSDFTPPWSMVWDTGEEASEGQMDAGAIDGKGVFSSWSLMTIPSQMWNQEMTHTCTAKESSTGRLISATVSRETEINDARDCMAVTYAGLPCISIFLLIQLFILLCRKCCIRGRVVQRGNQIPMRQTPQTEYASLPYNRNPPL